jgi:hypothetical protein
MGLLPVDVRFTPESGHQSAVVKCPLWATSGLLHRSKESLYSITSSAIESKFSGTSMPSARAVRRLMANSFVTAGEGQRCSCLEFGHSVETAESSIFPKKNASMGQNSHLDAGRRSLLHPMPPPLQLPMRQPK